MHLVAHLQNRTSLPLKPSFAKEPPSQRSNTDQNGQTTTRHKRSTNRLQRICGNSGAVVNRRSVLLRNFVLSQKEGASNPLLQLVCREEVNRS